jgi:hypothetical protein
MNVFAATCTVTFQQAKVYLEDGSNAWQDITIKVEGTDYTTQPFDIVMTVSNNYNVQVPIIKEHDGRWYRFWKWNTVGDIDITLINQANQKLIFNFHCAGGTSTASVEPKYARAGPEMDIMRGPVIRHPDAVSLLCRLGRVRSRQT